MNPTSSQIGFSRVVAPATQMNGGFSRLSYEMNGVELNGNRKLKRWFRKNCLLYTSPSPRDRTRSRMPSSA